MAHKSIIILFFTNAAAETLFAEVTNDMFKVSITNLTDSIIVKGFPHILNADVIYNTMWVENSNKELESKVVPYIKI